MTAIITNKFRIRNTASFLDNLANSERALLAFGRVEDWTPDAQVPATPRDDVYSVDFNEWIQMIGAKLITAADASVMVRRINWTAGTVYNFYDDTKEQISLEESFYAVTDDYDVYKCLNNGVGAQSTVKPTATVNTPFTSSDGYKWKYLYTLTQNEVAKFLTQNHMPAHTEAANATAEGAIYHVVVENGGSGYSATPFAVTVPGDGASFAGTAYTTGGVITHVIVTVPGTGYRFTSPVVFTAGGGTGAIGRAVISPRGGHGADVKTELGGFFLGLNVKVTGSEYGSFSTENDFRKINILINPTLNDASGGTANGGRLGSISINNPGSGYSSPPTLTIAEFGNPGGVPSATATASISGGGVTSIAVVAIGSNYSSAPIISFTSASGTGATAKAYLNGSTIGSIQVTNPGTGYITAPAVVIGGTGATAVSTIDSGLVNTITVTAPGKNYLNPIVEFTGGGGSGASASAETFDSYRIAYKFKLITVVNAPFGKDEVITTTLGATGRVVEHDTVNSFLYVTNVKKGPTGIAFDNGNQISQVSAPSKTAFINNAPTAFEPELITYSGDFLYLENRVLVSRAADQTESVTVVLEY